MDAAIMVEELYAVEPSVSLTLLGIGLGLSTLLMGGSAEQHKEFLAPFLSGDGVPLASLVYSEPGGTANFFEEGGKGMQTTARRERDEWVVNGEKVHIPPIPTPPPISHHQPPRSGPPTAPAGTSAAPTCNASCAGTPPPAAPPPPPPSPPQP